MRATEYETTHTPVVLMTTGTPIYHAPGNGAYPYGQAAPTAGPSHNRVAIIGATGVALLLAAMGGIAYFKAQDAAVPVVVVAPVTATVPHAAAAELADTLADAAVLGGTAGTVVAQERPTTVNVPHAATVELADSLADVPMVTVTVPHGAVPVE